jgi:hypothetical protein
MNAALQIAVDLEEFEIRLGTERVRLLPVAGDVFCLNDARGPLVRALKFEERSRLLAEVDDQDVASLIADAALVSSGVATQEVRVAVSLALAGGGEKAPPFAECAEFVGQRYGWDEKRIAETMALVIDRLCSPMVQQDGSGWKQIVFQQTDADLGALISQMATNLSQRAISSKREFLAEPEITRTKNSASTSPQPSAQGSVQSVSSVLPVKRTPFRVLGVNTNKTTQTEASRIASSSIFGDSQVEMPTPTSPKPIELLNTPRIEPRSVPLSTTVAAPSLNLGFPATPQTPDHHPASRSDHAAVASFSLSQSAALARNELPATVRPGATFPVWPPFETSSSNTQSTSERVRTSSRAFPVATAESQPATDWLAELAQLLEAECDMRGIDP